MRFDYTVTVLLPHSSGFFFMSLDVEYLQIFLSLPADVTWENETLQII